VEINERVPLYV